MEHSINNIKKSMKNYLSFYILDKKYEHYINDDENNNFDNEWYDCEDMIAYNDAYNEVMKIKQNTSFIEYMNNYINNKKNVSNENKFIKEQTKSNYEYLFYKYYEYLLKTKL